MFGLQPLRHISTLPNWADPDWCEERQLWGTKTNSRRQG
jgi:hypothetical protein